MLAPNRYRLACQSVLLVSLATSLGGGCDPSEGSYRSGPVAAPFNFKDVKVTTNRAGPGDSITLTWNFASAGDLVDQALDIWTHSIDFPAPETVALNKSARSFTFTFSGPVTLNLHANGKQGRRVNTALDVLLKEDYFFRIRKAVLSNSKRPALGQPSSSKKLAEFNFSNFVAVYDEDHNGLIDDLANDSYLSQLFQPKNTFLMHSSNNTETAITLSDGSKVGQLTHAFGSACPIIEPGFFLTSTGSPLLGKYLYNDVFIFGVGLAYDGDDVNASDDKGNKIPARRNATRFDPVFVCIQAVNSSDGPNIGPVITEIDVGNAVQGLALSAHRPIMPASDLTTGAWSIQFSTMPSAGNPKSLSGSICDAKIGWIVTTYDGTQLSDANGIPGVTVELGNPPGVGKPCEGGIEFNVPFVIDDEIQ